MRGNEFLDKMELVDAAFVEEADRQPSFKTEQKARKGRSYMFRKIAAFAAVVALMVCSGAVGAIAFHRETVIEVPANQETIELEAIGLTLILPDSWKRKVHRGNGRRWRRVLCVCTISTRKRQRLGQQRVSFLGGAGLPNEPLTPQQLQDRSPVPCIYLFATSEDTYDLKLASDVSYDIDDPEIAALYTTMYQQISDIQFVCE